MRHAWSLPKPSPRWFLQTGDRLMSPLYWWYEQQLIRAISRENRLPQHLGIILDGNRRFARSLGLESRRGHDLGAYKAYEVLEWCLSLGIPHVTIWVFSSDNKSRHPEEVHQLLQLFAREARQMLKDDRIHRNRVRIKMIGQIDDFPEDVRESLLALEAATAHYGGLLLNVAVGYGGREEIAQAVRNLLKEKSKEKNITLDGLSEDLSVADIDAHMYTAGLPDPDFVIRTSGEIRLSGFLLWQSAYSEYYFCDAYWPSFRRVDFLRAIRSFQNRKRRFGR